MSGTKHRTNDGYAFTEPLSAVTATCLVDGVVASDHTPDACIPREPTSTGSGGSGSGCSRKHGHRKMLGALDAQWHPGTHVSLSEIPRQQGLKPPGHAPIARAMSNEASINSGVATFQQDAIEASRDRLVLVDFWASWCGPCRSLAPVLEKLAGEYRDSLKLVKVDTDREQALAMQFGIRSLPTVLFFREGRVVDQFMGALPEADIREKIDRYASSSHDLVLAEARDLYQDGMTETAKELLVRLMDSMPNNDAPRLQFMAWLSEEGDMEGAGAMAESISLAGRENPEYRSFQATLEFLQTGGDGADRDELAAALAEEPGNLDVRYRLARLLVARREYAQAMDHLLEIIRRDRSFENDGARKTMLKIFELLGGKGELVSEYRTRLSRTLF